MYIYSTRDGFPKNCALTQNIDKLELILGKDKDIYPTILVDNTIFPKSIYDNWCKDNINLKDKYPNIFSLKWLDC